jgi:hypothetical protein
VLVMAEEFIKSEIETKTRRSSVKEELPHEIHPPELEKARHYMQKLTKRGYTSIENLNLSQIYMFLDEAEHKDETFERIAKDSFGNKLNRSQVDKILYEWVNSPTYESYLLKRDKRLSFD